MTIEIKRAWPYDLNFPKEYMTSNIRKGIGFSCLGNAIEKYYFVGPRKKLFEYSQQIGWPIMYVPRPWRGGQYDNEYILICDDWDS